MENTAIKLKDLINLSDEDLKRAKVRLNMAYNKDYGSSDPMQEYLRDPEVVNTGWLFWRYKTRFFKVGEIAVCLFRLSNDRWLLSTIKEVTKDLDVRKGVNYEGREIDSYSQYYGRLVIRYHNKLQTSVRWLEPIIDELEVEQILPSIFDGVEFPGYDKVRLSYQQLSVIIKNNKSDWIAAFKNQKAVYLITDTKSGKHYVGSAYGENGMLLQRWISYVDNGHGGNKLLKEVVKENGFDYIKQNFQYAILENYNAHVDKRIILERESWWKDTLGSKAFGLNAN